VPHTARILGPFVSSTQTFVRLCALFSACASTELMPRTVLLLPTRYCRVFSWTKSQGHAELGFVFRRICLSASASPLSCDPAGSAWRKLDRLLILPGFLVSLSVPAACLLHGLQAVFAPTSLINLSALLFYARSAVSPIWLSGLGTVTFCNLPSTRSHKLTDHSVSAALTAANRRQCLSIDLDHGAMAARAINLKLTKLWKLWRS
jgi:hypothetical protein